MPQENIEKRNKPACKNLRTKMYYVNVSQGLDSINMEKDDSMTQYWCLKTMQPIGPDERSVHRSDCCNPFRKCFESPDK